MISIKQLLKKSLIYTVAVGCFYFGGKEIIKVVPLITAEILMRREDRDIKEYVENNLEQVIENQERVIGINYEQKRPPIEYRLPSKYWEYYNYRGLYINENDTLYLNSGFLTLPVMDIGDRITHWLIGSTSNVKEVLDHELGHFYCDKLSEKLNINQDHDNDSYIELFIYKMVMEGIGEYFQARMNDIEIPFKDEYWPTKFEDFLNTNNFINQDIFYKGGYHLVKPIIDQFGETGIAILLLAPPKNQEICHLNEYQQAVIETLSQMINKKN